MLDSGTPLGDTGLSIVAFLVGGHSRCCVDARPEHTGFSLGHVLLVPSEVSVSSQLLECTHCSLRKTFLKREQ